MHECVLFMSVCVCVCVQLGQEGFDERDRQIGKENREQDV